MISNAPYRIAILEDDAFQRKMLESLCASVPGFEVKSFAEPDEALEVMNKERFHIVLVDINMPGMFGDDVLRFCMGLKLGIQVYVITGAENMLLADRCLNLGARIIIRKPVSQQAILEALTDARVHLDRCRETLKTFARRKMEA